MKIVGPSLASSNHVTLMFIFAKRVFFNFGNYLGVLTLLPCPRVTSVTVWPHVVHETIPNMNMSIYDVKAKFIVDIRVHT